MKSPPSVRILMYSHDTFGLGHIRRCQAIAHAIVDRFKGATVVIISGSQFAGAFEFRDRVDFVKIPSVTKLCNGEYDSVSGHIDIGEILVMREQVIKRTAEVFKPDIFITDKEPLGLRGELEPTLKMLSQTPTKIVLGLRDVIDCPLSLHKEWEKSDVLGKIREYYHRIWVYDPKSFWDPLDGLGADDAVLGRLIHTGFLRRQVPSSGHLDMRHIPNKFILVTTGGGGDGSSLFEQVLSAREFDIAEDFPLLMVLGPFMRQENRELIRQRASSLPNVMVFDFETKMEILIERATAVVGMCGYNTFCEVLSFNKKALFIPRTVPRREQTIRATRASELGLCEMLTPQQASNPALLAHKIKRLPASTPPWDNLDPSCLDGLENICSDIEKLISANLIAKPDTTMRHLAVSAAE